MDAERKTIILRISLILGNKHYNIAVNGIDAEERNITININIPDDDTPTVNGDEDQIDSVIEIDDVIEEYANSLAEEISSYGSKRFLGCE